MKRVAPAADRNKEPIAAVLQRVFPAEGVVLEVASGSGQHVVHFAARMAGLAWQPTEPEAEGLESIQEWRAESGLANVRPPLLLDVRAEPWPVTRADALLCINMIHIAPWEACLALFKGASRLLATGAPLVLYGPFKVHGEHTAPSNAAFDRGLRETNGQWGVRDLDDVEAVARAEGFTLEEIVDMPANNKTVVFRRT